MFYPSHDGTMGGDGVSIVGLFQLVIDQLLIEPENKEESEDEDDG